MYRELITFKNMPLSNNLLSKEDENVECYDLKVVFDDETKLVHLIDNVSPEKLFPDDYVYDSSQSDTMKIHFKESATTIQDRFKYSSMDKVF